LLLSIGEGHGSGVLQSVANLLIVKRAISAGLQLSC
jgi:hypothetical protein